MRFRVAGLLCLFAWLTALAATVAIGDDRLPVDIQIGFEQNETLLVGPQGRTASGDQQSDFSSTPVFKILSPIKLGCLNDPFPVDRGTSVERDACFGFGARFSGSQKRLAGRWFNLVSDPAAKPNYNYRSDQIAGEVLFGQLSEVSLAVGLGLRAGLNNYDLIVTNNDLILFEQRNKFRGFASWAFYLDLQVLLAWPFLVFDWPLSPVFLFYSYEQTFDGANTLSVPDINGTGEIDVDFQVTTQTITLEILF